MNFFSAPVLAGQIKMPIPHPDTAANWKIETDSDEKIRKCLGYHYGTPRDLAPKFAQLVGYVLYFTLVESIPVHVERSVQIQVEGVPFEIKW
mgnify:CR=1 FL=1